MHDMKAWTLPEELTPARTADASALLRTYFSSTKADGEPVYTGAMFERLGGGGDRAEVANAVTAEDIVAVSMLSVDVPGAASLRILGSAAAEIGRLLSMIPVDLDLADACDGEVGDGSPAASLWTLVRASGVGLVTTCKLLARNRPQLLPVIDTVVKDVLGHTVGATTTGWLCAITWQPMAAPWRRCSPPLGPRRGWARTSLLRRDRLDGREARRRRDQDLARPVLTRGCSPRGIDKAAVVALEAGHDSGGRAVPVVQDDDRARADGSGYERAGVGRGCPGWAPPRVVVSVGDRQFAAPQVVCGLVQRIRSSGLRVPALREYTATRAWAHSMVATMSSGLSRPASPAKPRTSRNSCTVGISRAWRGPPTTDQEHGCGPRRVGAAVGVPLL